jgi:ATP-dependent Clp protease protease subunit
VEKIAHDTDRDFYMNAETAMEYGVVDEILQGAAAEVKSK